MNTLRFGAFDVDLASGDVRRNGVPKRRLQDQPLKVLAALAERPGEVVTREELRHRLWPDDVHVDYERGLNKAVQKLRAVLDDPVDAPELIETIPRRGYRFVAPIERLEAGPTVPKPSGATARRLLSPIAALVAAALVAAIVLGLRFGRVGPARAVDSMRPPMVTTLAILPFRVLDSREPAPSLGLALTDTLITKLSNLPSLVVRPTSSIVGFANEDVDALDAGRRLAVEHVLEGSVQREGERLRVSVRLLRTSDGHPLWADILEADSSGLFELQDRLSEQVVGKLPLELSRAESSLLQRRFTHSVEAWEEYQRGRVFFERRGRENLLKAIAAFERSVAIDPGFALAYAGITHAYSPLLSWGEIPNVDGLARLRSAAERALELDDALAEAHTAAAQVYGLDWDFAGEERSYRRAIELNPNYSTAYMWYGVLLRILGRDQESTAMTRRAWELDPIGPTANANYALALFNGGYADQAIAQLERTLELAPSSQFVLRNLGTIHHLSGDSPRAMGFFERAAEPVFAACALAQNGAVAEARARLGELEKASAARHVSPYHLAAIHASLGENDEAFDLLEQAFRERIWELTYMNVDWRLRPLKSDPRFADLARRVGLPSAVGAG